MLLSSVGGCNIVFVFVFPAAPLCGGSRPATAGRAGEFHGNSLRRDCSFTLLIYLFNQMPLPCLDILLML